MRHNAGHSNLDMICLPRTGSLMFLKNEFRLKLSQVMWLLRAVIIFQKATESSHYVEILRKYFIEKT